MGSWDSHFGMGVRWGEIISSSPPSSLGLCSLDQLLSPVTRFERVPRSQPFINFLSSIARSRNCSRRTLLIRKAPATRARVRIRVQKCYRALRTNKYTFQCRPFPGAASHCRSVSLPRQPTSMPTIRFRPWPSTSSIRCQTVNRIESCLT